MLWTDPTRRHYVRNSSDYASDTTDAEWLLIAPFMLKPKRLGRRRATDLRRVVDAIFYLSSSGMPVAHAAKGFPATLDGAGLFLSVAR